MKTKNFLKIFAVLGFSILMFTSCGGKGESPEQVIENFKTNLTEIKSGDISTEVVMTGTDAQDAIDFTADMDIKFDRNDLEDRKADVNITLSGFMKAGDKSLEGDVDFTIRTFADNFYIRLDTLDSSDEGIAKFQPYISKYIGKWLHVASDFIPENIRELQQKDEATLEKERQLKELFVTTDLFMVTKEYGFETVNGTKVYHYGVQFSEEGVKDYIRKAAIIDGRELTDAEIEEASKIISYVSNAELWIGARDYYLYKAAIYMTGGVMAESDADMSINVTIEGTDYNKTIKITEPEDTEEFNPLELLMAFSTFSMEMDEADTLDDGMMMDEMMMDEMMGDMAEDME